MSGDPLNIDGVTVIPIGKTIKVIGKDSNGVFPEGKTAILVPFQIGRHLVTQDLYQHVMGYNPSSLSTSSDNGENSGQKPVDKVSWYHAIVFCNRLSMAKGLRPCYKINDATNPDVWGAVPSSKDNTWDAVIWNQDADGYRLPTEAEWEFAARGGGSELPEWNYNYAGSNSIIEVAWYSDNSDKEIHQVGLKQPNRLGIYDMSGNVYEWCWDWFGAVSIKEEVNPTGCPSGNTRVRRGGSWLNYARSCAVTYRNCDSPDTIYGNIGFRLARSML